MITKLNKIKNSWFIKFLLILTALSFVSLFGITGYLGSAGRNKPVIRVGNQRITQAELTTKFNHDLQMAKNMFGDNIEVNDAMKTAMLQGIIQKELNSAIIRETAQDLGISISNDYIRKIIFSQAEFLDADGRFNKDKFKRLLSVAGWSEAQYIQALKEDVIKQHLVYGMVENFNMPKFMTPYLEKAANQKKVFKYIALDTDKQQIDRQISADEIQQYYEDFAPQFIEPEKRDISFLILSTDDIAAQMAPNEEDIKAYYKENISQFVTPEKRNILQMVFDKQEDAEAALDKLKSGSDFYAVAQELAHQDKTATELGWVAKDQLITDMGDKMFSLKNGEIAGPVKSEMGWHIMKVTGTRAKDETSLAAAKAKIIGEIRKEKAYDVAYEITTKIEDEIGSGKTLEEIAKENSVTIYQAKDVYENGTAKSIPDKFKKLLSSNDFIDSAFSYNVKEISQVIEEEDGFVIVRVDAVTDAHPKDIDEVKGEIENLWKISERAAVTQEIINDVNHDLENGDKIEEVAARFKLPLQTTQPLKKNETFSTLNVIQMNELYQEPLGSPKVFNLDNIQMIAVNTRIIDDNKPVSKEEAGVIRMKAAAEISQDTANQLIDAYGSNYKIRVKYKDAGLDDL